ncbi:MAG: DUF6496 domain-containing protein [Candidatus Polarisedimenticolia bacterium]
MQKSPSTRAGKYVREEMHHRKEGEHPGMSRKQAIAVGLSKARRAGVKVPRKKKSSGRK